MYKEKGKKQKKIKYRKEGSLRLSAYIPPNKLCTGDIITVHTQNFNINDLTLILSKRLKYTEQKMYAELIFKNMIVNVCKIYESREY